MTTALSTRTRPAEFWTRHYWLEHCEGYCVDTPEGHVGFVEEVALDPLSDEPTALLVRRNKEGHGITPVALADVIGVRPEAETVLIATAPRR
jgi:hypothetical protein